MHSFTRVDKIIDTLLKQLSDGGFSREIKIGLLWRKTIGNLLADRTQIYKLENDVLFILVADNVWLQELVLQKPKIMEKINNSLSPEQKLKDIILSLSSKKIKI
jgi:predicted nucleic acid-binding Zn ribbon protein